MGCGRGNLQMDKELRVGNNAGGAIVPELAITSELVGLVKRDIMEIRSDMENAGGREAKDWTQVRSQTELDSEALPGGKELGNDDVGEALGESDDFCVAPELMVHDTGATPTISPNPAFKHKEWQQGVVEPQQPNSGESQMQGEPDEEEEFNEATFTSSLDLTPSGGAKVCWWKSKDVIPLHWSSGLSAIEPGLTANTTTASSVGSSRVPSPLPELEGTAKLEGGSSGREKTNGNMQVTLNTNGHGYAAQSNGRFGGGVNGMGLLPLPLSIPGLGVLVGGGALWMGSMGKKLGELRDSPMYMFLRFYQLDSSLE
ncbi:uncharacterized protein LACBIDRAFT_328432 [Laccaria bicolor S238N-H82]|uniref:Predicted protein n=1 Tax=Laccaria bicolor (strain S238N-H82 / ATCC MYA-4686) TaxID=486041 RepID=B0DET5_LACBS|nr:uncharacterized protein LACBIDRAFT_328432 [Laccaria bicolor S238N-H82]EDR06996.1 predicted protein [Laccaria bicolor S238N-H82]|eukprot:XP_001882369.1 predicted protein [Laccaria bicolor S238N-H82]